MIGRFRLIDAVAVAAGALLLLKVIGLFDGAPPEAGRPSPNAVAAEQSRAFAHALAKARTNYEPPDVTITNAVVAPEKPDDAAAAKSEAAPGAPQALPKEVAATPPSPTERAILEKLGQRREEWQQKSKDFDLRERMLEDAERKLESRINELKTIEERNEAAAAKRGDTEAGALKNLVTMYETMKPKDAARVFDRLPHDVLVPVVLMMNPRKMAEVLAVMTPESAERLTVALANRGRSREAAATGKPALPPNELPAIDAPKP